MQYLLKSSTRFRVVISTPNNGIRGFHSSSASAATARKGKIIPKIQINTPHKKDEKLTHNRAWYGPPDPVSNIRPIKFEVVEGESEIEAKYRFYACETANWHNKFWFNHNSDFLREKAIHHKEIKENEKPSGVVTKLLSIDQLSEFYKNFLNERWSAHVEYNREWYRRNFYLLWLSFRQFSVFIMFNIDPEVLIKPVEFTFNYSTPAGDKTFIVDVFIPLSVSVPEYAALLMKTHNLPFYIERELCSALETFVASETEKQYLEKADAVIQRARDGQIDIDAIVGQWEKAYKEETLSYAKPEEISDEEVFSEAYHSTIHSPALQAVLQLEHSLAETVFTLAQEKDTQLAHLGEKQTKEISETVEKLGEEVTDAEINNLAAHHFEMRDFLQSKLDSQLNSLHDMQRKEFQQFIMATYEDFRTRETAGKGFVSQSSTMDFPEEINFTPNVQENRMEESFTIHLGTQKKQMYNIRLLSGDVLDFCSHQQNAENGFDLQRFQTAMSLYSHDLSGLVLLVDERINCYSGLKKDFASVCQKSTELHFSSLEEQLEQIRNESEVALEWRSNRKQEFHTDDSTDSVRSSNKSSPTSHNSSINSQLQSPKSPGSQFLSPGDFYLTRHSNLSSVHVVFHLIGGESLKSSNITSRHPVILGIRGILKIACRCNITTLTIPLFLTHEIAEDMNVQWCLKRAELVYKCVKGFMMEMVSWGGGELKTLQFLVPQGISEELYSNLATMLPTIFRVSNPLVLKSSDSSAQLKLSNK